MPPAKNATQIECLTPEQVAERLQVSRAAVFDWLRTGRLSGSKLGYRTWRITPAEIEALLERQAVGPSHREGREDALPPTPRGELSSEPRI